MDQENSTPVAIVNEKMAHDYWPDGEALGKRIQLPGEKQMRQIVGIAQNRQLYHLGEAAATVRLCASGTELFRRHDLVCAQQGRSTTDPDCPFSAKCVRAGPQISVNDARTGRTIIDGRLVSRRRWVWGC